MRQVITLTIARTGEELSKTVEYDDKPAPDPIDWMAWQLLPGLVSYMTAKREERKDA